MPIVVPARDARRLPDFLPGPDASRLTRLAEHRHLRSARVLAIRSAPARAIQELAGHRDLSITQRYVLLSPAVLDAAIRLLEKSGGAVSGAPRPAELWRHLGDGEGLRR